MKKTQKIDAILKWIEDQQLTSSPSVGPVVSPQVEHSTIHVRLKTDTEDEANFIRKLLLQWMPGLSLNGARQGTHPRYIGRQKWFLYGDLKITADGEQIKRRRRNDVGKKRGKRTRNCSVCGQHGHFAPKCPKRPISIRFPNGPDGEK